MSNFRTLKYRQCTDTYMPHIWFVYHDFGNNNHSLVKECKSREEAVALVKTMLLEEIEGTILGIDSTQDVTHEFLDTCFKDECNLSTAVESFFNDCSFDISQLQPLKGRVDEAHAELNKLTRPYIAISNDDHQTLTESKADYYLTSGGQVVTFGNATVAGGNTKFALMPLQYEEAQKILSQQ